jgi:hypothetical protein
MRKFFLWRKELANNPVIGSYKRSQAGNAYRRGRISTFHPLIEKGCFCKKKSFSMKSN